MDDFERLLCLKWIIKNSPQYHILSSTSIHCRYPRHFFKLKFRNSLKKHNMNMQFCFLYWFVNLTSILLKIENVTNSMQILFSHVKCPVYEMFYKNATCCLWNVLSIKCPVFEMTIYEMKIVLSTILLSMKWPIYEKSVPITCAFVT